VLLEGLGHPCRAVANPAEARVALDQHSFDVVLLELTHADDDGINLVRDLARTGRQISVVPMVSIPRAWAPSIARKWNLKTPLVRPHRFVELYDALR
ncbi:MAG: hypothetical protein HY293_23070, partial [Planctomycetes bacterium]|nr:hypothetical protein [Planctomycetota bacterium]